MILAHNTLITATPNLTTSSNNTSDKSGLYVSTATNSGNPTYYFRGNITNNYVSFAGFTWRIVRINEDGTIRLIMANGINNNATYAFNAEYTEVADMYYSNSNAKTQLESWYNTNLANYSSYISTGNYFCQQAKVGGTNYSSLKPSGIIYPSNYTPNFKCSTDANGYGKVNASIGLINYDEEVFAGGSCFYSNTSYYLYNGSYYWTMSPAGHDGIFARGWFINYEGYISDGGASLIDTRLPLRPVIIIKANVLLKLGNGTSTNPYVIK